MYKKLSRRIIIEYNIVILNKDSLKRESDSIDISIGQLVNQYKRKKRKNIPLNISKEYIKYT